MNIDPLLLARMQFGITAAFHFAFVPLSIGVIFMLAIMETIYVKTKDPGWKQVCQFLGVVFGLNFAFGAATGIPLEFQFGTNWANYAHYVGDVFGSILALEGMMAFFIESTLIGIFFFGWSKLKPHIHLAVTWGLAISTNISGLWILIANGWMQNPVGSIFNPKTQRMELTSFKEVFFNPVAIAKFGHTITACYIAGSVFILSIAGYYLLRKKFQDFAYKSIMVAAPFGLLACIGLIIMGDQSGHIMQKHQPIKLACIEGMWETQKPPAAFTLFGVPDQKNECNHYAVEIPSILGILVTRSTNTPIMGIKDLRRASIDKIRQGQKIYALFEDLKKSPTNQALQQDFHQWEKYLGYGLLLKRYCPTVVDASEEQILQAAKATIPRVAPLFWSFRLMVGIGFLLLLYFATNVYYLRDLKTIDRPWLNRWRIVMLPLPWIAMYLGWFVTEYGRQPWAIYEILPTFLASSAHKASKVAWSFASFVGGYSLLALLDLFIVGRMIHRGPKHQ